MKRLANFIAAVALMWLQTLTFVPATFVQAHNNNEPHNEPPTSNSDIKTTSGYEFVTPKGCSLSLLTRRALQLYDQQKDDISLNEAAIIYAETNVVQRLGSRPLDIGEHVKIDQSLLDEYAQKSKSLTADQMAAWQAYAINADFDLNYISPVATSSLNTEKPSEEKSEATSSQPEKDKSDINVQNKAKTRQRTVWWAAALGALYLFYSLLPTRPLKRTR